MFFLAAWGITHYILITFTNSTVPLQDSFTNALSFVGLWALARKYIEQWFFERIFFRKKEESSQAKRKWRMSSIIPVPPDFSQGIHAVSYTHLRLRANYLWIISLIRFRQAI